MKRLYPYADRFEYLPSDIRRALAKRECGARFCVRFLRFEKTGEYRAPRAGEFYLSGAIPEAYFCPADFEGATRHILRVAGTVREVKTEVLEVL